MRSKGFYQPLLFVIIMAVLISYFAFLHIIYIDKAVAGTTTLRDSIQRAHKRINQDLRLMNAVSERITSGDDTAAGFTLQNLSSDNAFKVSVYWASPSRSTTLCRLVNGSAEGEFLEVKRNESVTLDTTACAFGSTMVSSGDYFIINTNLKTFQRFV